MTDLEKQELRELLKKEIEQGNVLERDKMGRGFVCPSCGNGAGKKGDGLHFKRDSDLLHCFSCGSNFDPFEALKQSESLPDFPSTINRACELTGFSPVGDKSRPTERPQNDRKAPQSPKSVEGLRETPQTARQPQNAKKVDYSNYYEECFARNDGSELKKRGISEEVQIRHKIGIDPNFQGTGVARLIISTSSESFVGRKIGPVCIDKSGRDDRIRNSPTSEGQVFHLLNEETLFDKEDNRPCFVVEGPIDALSLEEIGYRAVGLCGLSGTNRLLELLRGASNPPTLILALDNDKAGREAQDGKIDASTGYLDPRKKGLYMEIASRGLQVFRADYTGESWTSTEKPLKDVNDFLIESREDFERWAKEQVEQAEIGLSEERAEYLAESSNALDYFDREINQISKPTPTGFSTLDRLLGGGLRVGLTTLGAGTSFGKTALTMQIAENMARNGSDVLFFSLEMGANELRARSLSRLTAEILDAPRYSGVPASSYSDVVNYRNLTNEDQYRTINEARAQYKTYCPRIRIVESQGEFSVEDVRKAVSKHKRLTGRTPVVFIDYLQILHPLNPRESEKQQTDKNILELRRIAREFSASVVVLSSLNRAGYKKKPTLESFKESGGVEYGSDIVLMLSFEQREELYIETIDEETGRKKKVYDYNRAKRENPRKMLLSLLKNRNGNPTGEVYLDSYSRFSLFVERQAQGSI